MAGPGGVLEAGKVTLGVRHEAEDAAGRVAEAGDGVDGELASVVGGAVDKPIPSAPKRIDPKGAVGFGEHTGGLLEAKRRAQQKIKQQQEE